MTPDQKNQLLEKSQAHVQVTQEQILVELERSKFLAADIFERLPNMRPSDQLVQSRVMQHAKTRVQELGQLHPSPYFVRCEVRLDGEVEVKIWYFAKFALPEQNLFSWISPAAVIRFETPGRFTYAVPGEKTRTGELLSKDQFLIAGGKIIFMATESKASARELVYQEYFSQRKTAFILPEIVEQMEKAQDAVVRAPYQGPFLVAGPAGSGKTTLALHRVAYLMQSPDTASMFAPDKVMVLVQDASTRDYFNHLLPELGVGEVQVTTWADWLIAKLNLYDYSFVSRVLSEDEVSSDFYEFQKYQALRQLSESNYSLDIYVMLSRVYEKTLSSASKLYWDQQQKQEQLDRFDLTILAQIYVNTHGALMETLEEMTQLKGGKIKRTRVPVPLQYNLMILDEVQNYLPEQLSFLQSCINKTTRSLVYVGDLAQQTQLCTVRDWEQVGEAFPQGRKAVLQKVYRSTKQILEYIRDAGFALEIPDQARTGTVVNEISLSGTDILDYLVALAEKNVGISIGVLAKQEHILQPYREPLKSYSNMRLLSINEAQGVEFDVVCLLGVSAEVFLPETADYSSAPELLAARKQVNRDLLYVALTRAMNELHVVGNVSTKEIVKKLVA